MSANWEFTIRPGASECDMNLAREFWQQSELGGKQQIFDFKSRELAEKYGVTVNELRTLQQAMVIQAPDTLCKRCKRGLTWRARSFSSRADFQGYVDQWKATTCNECRAALKAEYEAFRVEREKQHKAEAAARKANLRQRYRERAVKDCPNCDGLLLVRKSGRGGMFIGCSEYPTCRFTMPIPKPKHAEVTPGEMAEVRRALADLPQCSKCRSPMKKIDGKYGAFLGCTNYPRCRETVALAAPTPAEPAQSRETFEEQERARMRRAIEDAEKRFGMNRISDGIIRS